MWRRLKWIQYASKERAMEMIDGVRTARLLPYPLLTEALGQMLLAVRDGRVTAPPRSRMPLGAGGSFLLMPATSSGLVVVKVVTVHAENEQHDLPNVQATLLVLDARTGQRLYLVDGDVVTARRTAALSLLAAQRLAPDAGGPLLVIGSGVQARAHLEAFVAGFGLQHVYIASRTLSHAERLAADAQREFGIVAQAIASPAAILPQVSLIVTATTSMRPVLRDEIRQDAFVAAVGAYLPEMAEVPAALVRRSTLYVDTLEGAQAGAGDLIQAGVDWQKVIPLERVMDRPRQPSDGPVLFKSVGHAFWDLAAAEVVHRQMQGGGVS